MSYRRHHYSPKICSLASNTRPSCKGILLEGTSPTKIFHPKNISGPCPLIQSILKQTAILLFSDYRPEQASKVFAHGKGLAYNARIAEGMFQHTLAVAQESGLPLVWIASHQQTGSTFGQRFAHAIAQVFEQGYEHIISIGDDCPELEAQDLQIAARNLEKGIPSLGPARDGGVYLIGLSRQLFHEAHFSHLAWCGQHTAHSLEIYFREQGAKVSQLDYKRDIDHARDFQALGKELPRKHFFQRFIRLGQVFHHLRSPQNILSLAYKGFLSLAITRPPPFCLG